MAIADLWSQRGILYQIHPHSFRDSNDDGIGDRQAIIERLPYLKSLGIHAVWQSPVFPSPIADFGYDVFDYTGLDPISIGTSGTMARPTAGRQNNWLFEFSGSLATRRGSWTILVSRFPRPAGVLRFEVPTDQLPQQCDVKIRNGWPMGDLVCRQVIQEGAIQPNISAQSPSVVARPGGV
jgi:Alpha amylase, catalytic domain